ncbi:MAG: DUF488 family protein [Pseudonocardiaceae bacterium]
MTGPQLVTVGYEGRSADEIVAELCAAEVTVLIDVRLTPLSRKPGLSKRRLSQQLYMAGIRYVHLPSLGNPRDNRDPFRASDPAALERFRGILRAPEGAAGVEEVAELVEDTIVALLCFERESYRCHRQLIADRLHELYPLLTVRHVY